MVLAEREVLRFAKDDIAERSLALVAAYVRG